LGVTHRQGEDLEKARHTPYCLMNAVYEFVKINHFSRF
jgi:hypothetical protein